MGTPPGMQGAIPARRGLGAALRSLYTAAPPRQPARCSGRRGSLARGAPTPAEKGGVTLQLARQGHGLPGTRGLPGPLSSGSAITESPTALLSSRNFTPHVPGLPLRSQARACQERARPRATAGRRARGGVPGGGQRGPRGQRERDPSEGEREIPAVPAPARPPPVPRGKGRRLSCPGWGSSGEMPRRRSAPTALGHTLGTRSRKTWEKVKQKCLQFKYNSFNNLFSPLVVSSLKLH